jgi:hypothetical protein
MIKFLEVAFIFWAVVAPEVGVSPIMECGTKKSIFSANLKAFPLIFFAFLQAHAGLFGHTKLLVIAFRVIFLM